MYFFFSIFRFIFIRTYKIYWFRQQCDYLIVSVSIESIYKIVLMSIVFCEKSQKMFFKRLQKRNKGQTNKKNNNCKLNANTEGISMTYTCISGHPLKGPT